MSIPIQLLTVTSRNKELRNHLSSLPVPSQHLVKVLGFTNEIHDLMAIADLVVSKPGGLTTSETLASGSVMVIVNPIPGQESRNSDYLLESGAAIKVNNAATLASKVSKLLADRSRLEQLRANVRRIARPRAAFDIVERSLALLSVSADF